MSETPRTDAQVMFPGGGIAMVRPEFAMQLERELDEACRHFDKQLEINDELRTRIARLEDALRRFDTGCRVFENPSPACGCIGCTARRALHP